MIINIWTAVISKFGGKPLKHKIENITSYKVLLFATFLDGVVFWASYRGFLFYALSSKHPKYPFNDLNSLIESDYRYVLIVTSLIGYT